MAATTKGPERGKRALLAIHAKGLSQAFVARELKISKQALGELLHGRVPGERHMADLARILAVPEQWLREGGEDPAHVQAYLLKSLATPKQLTSDFFFVVMRNVFSVCRHRMTDDPKFMNELQGQISQGMFLAIAEQRTPGPKTESATSYFAMLKAVGIPPLNAEEEAAFIRGHSQYTRDAFGITCEGLRNKEDPDPSLPMDVFTTIIRALHVINADRIINDRDNSDVREAISVLWRRQASKAIETGPDHPPITFGEAPTQDIMAPIERTYG